MTVYEDKEPAAIVSYGDFMETFERIPKENRRTWAEHLTVEQMKFTREEGGLTIAHYLTLLRYLGSEYVSSLGKDAAQELLLLRADDGWTVAHTLALKGNLPEEWMVPEIFTCATNNGTTVAYIIALTGKLPEKWLLPEILVLQGEDRATVAHALARDGKLPEHLLTKEILSLANGDGNTVAHILASRGLLPDEWLTFEILSLKNGWGGTVAHSLVQSPIPPEQWIPRSGASSRGISGILSLADDRGQTVAHALARLNKLPAEYLSDELLLLADRNLRTVAHELALHGSLPRSFQTPKILSLFDSSGRTVAGHLADRVVQEDQWDLVTEELLNAPYRMEKHSGEFKPKIRTGKILLDWILSKSGWNRLTPEILNAPCTAEPAALQTVKKALAKMTAQDLKNAVVGMPRQTKCFILSKSRKTSALSRVIQSDLDAMDREASYEIFSQESVQNSEEEWDENLYGAGREQ